MKKDLTKKKIWYITERSIPKKKNQAFEKNLLLSMRGLRRLPNLWYIFPHGNLRDRSLLPPSVISLTSLYVSVSSGEAVHFKSTILNEWTDDNNRRRTRSWKKPGVHTHASPLPGHILKQRRLEIEREKSSASPLSPHPPLWPCYQITHYKICPSTLP